MFLPIMRSRCFLNLLVVTALTAQFLHAAPYGPEGKAASYRQPDGTTVKVRVFGDEFFAVAETFEGYTVVYDKDKVLTYGNLSADGKTIVSTGIRASNEPDHAKLQTLGIKKNIRLNPQGRKAAVDKGLQRMRADRKGRVTPQSLQYYSKSLPDSGAQFASPGTSELPPPPPSYAPPTSTRLGDYVGLCILIDFSDQAGTIVRSAVDDYCNKPGYTGYSNAGSIYDYFFTQSGGRLRYNNIVTAYVRVPNPKSYYDDGSDLPWGSSKAQKLVQDSLDVLMAQGFDFTQISRNASGEMYSVNVFYAGTCASAWSTGLWPSSWAIPTKTVDAVNGIKAYSYQMTDMGTSLDIGTFCHENGHMLLDYPDLYPYNGNAADFGSYSLMSGGNHADGGRHPTNIDPYLKAASGWANIVDLDSTSHQRCTIQADSNLFYRYRNSAKLNEYFIFEVRDNTGYEGPYGGSAASVNPSAGLVAYHVREDGSNTESTIFTANNPNCIYTTPYEILLVEANQSTAKTPWYDDPTPDTSDAFKSTGKNEISDITTPALKFWDATGRNTASGAVIHSISADGPTMTFVAGAGDPTGSASIVLSRTTIDSFCDFGYTAAAQTFSIGNGGGGTLSYTISDNQTWLSCTPASGTATTESDTITVNFSTSGLAAGAYSATITLTDPLATPATKNIAVNLTVNARPVMALSVASIVKAGIAGSSGPQASFAIKNTGGGTMDYAVSKTQPWFSLTPSSGTVVGETDTIYIDFNATSLARGTYTDTITITSASATNSPLTIPVTFTVDGADMVITAPNGGESWVRGSSQNITWVSGIGGNVKLELLKNGALSTTISASSPNDNSFAWSIPANQTLGTNYRIRITSVETPAATDVSFTDFSIVPPPIYYASMDTNPGWTLDTSWAYGVPTGAGQDGYGGPDPTSGQNGTNVIGYRLDGDYEPDIAATRWATTPAINCTGRQNVKLSFQRWLGVEGSYDHAYVEASNNGTTWTQVWASPSSTVNDNAWTYCEYDVSAVADGQATVYIRWGLGTTDYGWNWCGWNLDEVLVDGDYVGGGAGIVLTESGGSTAVTEGGATDSYSIALATQPTASVTITATPNAQVSVSPASLTFTTSNWATPQNISVTAVNDSDIEASPHVGSILHSTASADADYNGSSLDGVQANVTDNDNTPPSVDAGPAQTINLSGSTWSPLALAPKLWLDAADTDTITLNGSTVSQWDDKSGLNRHATQATAGNQPANTPAGLDGKRVLTFDGSNDFFSVDLDFLANVSHSAFIVTKPTIYSNIYGAATAAAGAKSLHIGFNGSANYRMNFWANDYGPALTANFRAGSANILNFAWTSGIGKQIFANGGSEGSNTNAGTIGTMSGGGRIGHTTTASHGAFGGDIAEFIILTGTVNLADRESLEGYLAHKWGLTGWLPTNHTYKTNGPNDAEATASLDGTTSDADGHTLTTTWSFVSGPAAVVFGNANSVDTTATFTVEGIYTLRLTAADGFTQTTDDVVITVGSALAGYNVTYAGNNSTGGTVPVDGNNPHNDGTTVTVLGNTGALVRTGYTFNNWNTAANGSGNSYAAGATFTISAHTTLYAQWTPNNYTVTFDKQSGSGGIDNVTATYGSAMPSATAPTRTGYTFGGYYTQVSGGGIQYYSAAMASSRNWDLTVATILFAKWNLPLLVNAGSDQTVSISAVSPWTPGITYYPITGDVDSGISSNKVYTHALDFGLDAARALINGVQFQAGGTTFGSISGTSATIGTGSTTIPTAHAGDASAAPFLNGASVCAMEGLVKDMNYNAANGVITLTGLTPGAHYQFRLYNRVWGSVFNRSQNIGFETNGVGSDITGSEYTATFNEDDARTAGPRFSTFSQVYALTLDYTLAPGVTSLKVYINQTGAGTYHLYGLTNESIPTPVATANLTGTASGPEVPAVTTNWTVVNTPVGGSATFADASALNTTVSFNAPGTYLLRITAINGIDTVSDDVFITVAGSVDHFAISAIASPQTVGTPISGLTITAQDAANTTAISFTGTVNFGGTAGITGTSASFVNGVLSELSVTPTVAGNDLNLTVNDGASHTGSITIATIRTPFVAWTSSNFANGILGNKNTADDFDAGGLTSGVEWVVGGDPTVASDDVGKAPTFDNTTDPDYFIHSYRRTDAANADPKTNLVIEYGSDLSGWTDAVDDGTNVIIIPSDDSYGPGVDKVEVKIKRTLAPSGTLFSRLKVVIEP